jgi:hypothetical protein
VDHGMFLYILDPLRRNKCPTTGTGAYCSHTADFFGDLFMLWDAPGWCFLSWGIVESASVGRMG